ncbi:MAG: glycerol-3-phosphate acyltransferase [Anaerolineae bacterium]|nr:glycerol-3-phosphate acyltransferase [Anaerolineae bacterium]
MPTALELLLAGLWGYLVGAVPTGVVVSKLARGKDVRQHGSGHTGGTNVARVAGAWAGVLTAVIDGLLGLAAVLGANSVFNSPWAGTAAGTLAVIGHDWSVLIHFGGGIGLAKLVGALVGLDPLRALAALTAVTLLWLLLTRLLHFHRARSTILVMALAGPLLWLMGASPPTVLLGALGGLVVILKTIPDWNRKYA